MFLTKLELADVGRWNEAGFNHAAHVQVTNPLSVFTVSFIAFLRFRVLGMGQGDPTDLFEDIEHWNPVFLCGFHTDVRTGVFRKPVSQILKSLGERGGASLLVLCPAIGIGNPNAGKYPSFVDVQTTAVFEKNLKGHMIPPIVY